MSKPSFYYDSVPPYQRGRVNESDKKFSPFYQQKKYSQLIRESSQYPKLDLRELENKEKSEREKVKELTLIDDTYILGKKIGKGSFGTIYLSHHKWTGDPVAVKLEPINSKSKILEHEFKVYQDIYKPNNGISQCHHYGIEDDFCVMVVDLLGDSLGALLDRYGGKFSLKTTLMIGDQLINRLEYLHENAYLHRDLKPDNMLIGRGHQFNKVYLIDYGLSKKFRQSDGTHLPYREGNKFIGTARYASVNAHLGKALSRRDDLISLAYILIYFVKGTLPWQKVTNKDNVSKSKKYNEIRDLKVKLTPAEICQGIPVEFARLLEYSLKLEFEKRPDYHFLKRMFKDLMIRNGYQYDLIFDWNEEYVNRGDSKKLTF